MREFGLIGTVIWQSQKWKRLKSDDARLAYFYLHTNRLSTSAGCYQLPEAVALSDLGWTKAKWRRARDDLIRVNLIEFDAAEQTFFIVKFPQVVKPLGPSHLTGILRLLEKVPSKALAKRMTSEFKALRPKLKLRPHNQNQNQNQKIQGGPPTPRRRGDAAAGSNQNSRSNIDEAFDELDRYERAAQRRQDGSAKNSGRLP
jgi:hypothetical protein